MDPSLFTARPRVRLKAFAWDYLVISAYLVVLVGVGTLVAVSTGSTASPPSRIVMELVAFTTTVLPVVLYFALQEGGRHHATIGKRRVGIRVTEATGTTGNGASAGASRSRAILRNALKFAPWQLAHSSLFQIPGWPFDNAAPAGLALAGLAVAWGLVLLYAGSLVLSKDHRTLYDRISGTIVVADTNTNTDARG